MSRGETKKLFLCKSCGTQAGEGSPVPCRSRPRRPRAGPEKSCSPPRKAANVAARGPSGLFHHGCKHWLENTDVVYMSSMHVEVCQFLEYNHPQSRIRLTAKRYSHTVARRYASSKPVPCLSFKRGSLLIATAPISSIWLLC